MTNRQPTPLDEAALTQEITWTPRLVEEATVFWSRIHQARNTYLTARLNGQEKMEALQAVRDLYGYRHNKQAYRDLERYILEVKRRKGAQ